MEFNKLYDYKDKNIFADFLDSLHNSECRFLLESNKCIVVKFESIEGERYNLFINFNDDFSDSFSIYEFKNNSGLINGSLIDNNIKKDIEILTVPI